jgi:hypothetical protein
MALAFALVGYVALVIAGFGVVSLTTNQDVIAVSGSGQLPGILGVILASGAFAGILWLHIRRGHPSFWAALWIAAGSFLAYLFGVGVAEVAETQDVAAAATVVAHLSTTLFGAVVGGAALVAAWCGIALVRTRARRPRWPWEHDEDE